MEQEITENNRLTKYPQGSVRELFFISFPLMLSSFTYLLMLFVDRCFLSKYSLDALNAVTNSGTLAWAYFSFFGMIAGMSEIFVAQYYGRGLFEKIGSPVWQMIWLAVFSIAIYIPLGLWFAPFVYKNSPLASLEISYFQMLIYFAPTYTLLYALTGFFVGRGKTFLLIGVAIVGNIVNFFGDWALIFGVPGIIPEMGVKGAALATSFSTIIEAIILLWFFFRKEHRIRFGTTQWQFNFSLFKKCCKVGLPQAVFYSLEIIGWALFFSMMLSLGPAHMTISSICQSLSIFLSFFFDGLSRGLSAIAASFIGGKRFDLIGKLIKSACILQLGFSCLLFFIFIFDPQDIMKIFFSLTEHTFLGEWHQMFSLSLIYVFIYLFFEGIRWILSGLLTAAGDTFFLLITGSVSVWLFLLLPVYLIVFKHHYSVDVAWLIAAFYAAFLCVIYLIRIKQGKWKTIDLIAQETLEKEKILP